MPANDPKVTTIVAEALKRTDPAARATYLDSVCADDAGIRQQVEALLATHDAAGRPVETDATGMHESTSPDFKPAFNHCTRCAAVPWVKESGTA